MGCPARNRTFHVNCGEAKAEKKGKKEEEGLFVCFSFCLCFVFCC